MTLYHNGPLSECPLGHVPLEWLFHPPERRMDGPKKEMTSGDLALVQRINDSIAGIEPPYAAARRLRDYAAPGPVGEGSGPLVRELFSPYF